MYQQAEQNLYSLNNPKPGNYWSERFVGICIVLEVTDNHVYICNKKIDIDENHWTFDLNYITQLTKDQFVDYLSYSTKELGTFRNVSQNEKYYIFVEEYLERKKNNNFTVIIKNEAINEDVEAIKRIVNIIKLLQNTIDTEKYKLSNQNLIYHINRLEYVINNCERDLFNTVRYCSEPKTN